MTTSSESVVPLPRAGGGRPTVAGRRRATPSTSSSTKGTSPAAGAPGRAAGSRGTAADAAGARDAGGVGRRAARPTSPVRTGIDGDDPNVVRLVGRVGGEAEDRELPSGDHVVCWRVIVEQPPAQRRPGPRSRVDTIDCIAWSARARRSALALLPGDRVTVHGSLRRRFWQTPTGPASRYEVEVTALRRNRS